MEVQIKYKCGDCGEVHDDEDEADDCCRRNSREVYLCPKCNEDHRTRNEALACCKTDEEELDEMREFPPAHLPIEQYIQEFNRMNHLKEAE